MITLNAICLNWAIQQERMKELAVTTASDRKQILSLLLGNMQMHYTFQAQFQYCWWRRLYGYFQL